MAALRAVVRAGFQAAGKFSQQQQQQQQPHRGFGLSSPLGTVIVERWWKIPLSKEGRPPRMKHRRYRVYRLVEDTKHSPKEPLTLILTQTVEDVGNRCDVVSVDKSLGRNKLLAQDKAVYASPENLKIFAEERQVSSNLWSLPCCLKYTNNRISIYLALNFLGILVVPLQDFIWIPLELEKMLQVLQDIDQGSPNF
uniref:Large ribosomal subunit protein bL9m n=1 Tax=Anolis carolinensis TaxID=28377 RepID=H9GEJ8_ANOCA